MNKFLRYSLVALLCAMFNVSFAEEIKFDFDNDYATLFPTITGLSSGTSHDGDFTETTTSADVSGATVTVSAKTSGNNENRLWSASPRLRMYSGTFTVTAPAGKNISKIEFVGHKDNFNLSTSTGTLAEKTWTGNASEVVFNVAKNTQISSITLTVSGEGEEPQPEEAKITISGTNPFVNSTEVTISINRDASQIYYTLDGSDPETNEDAPSYSAPFTITESCKVRAWDEMSGAKAEMEFVKQNITTVNSIAEFLALENETVANLNLTDAVVLGNGNKNTVVKDATGSLLIYYLGQDVKQGQKLNGTVQGQRVVYAGLDELKVGKDNTVNITITDGTITPVEISAADIVGKELLTEVYKIKDVVVKKNADNNRYYIMNGDNEVIQLYDEFKIEGMIAEDGTYTIEGLRGKYNETAQVWLTKVGEGEEPQPGEITKVNNIAEFKALADNTEAELTLTNAKVVYKFVTNSANANTSIFVRDNSGAICFFNVAKDLNINDDVNGTIIVKRTNFRALPQAQAVEGKTNTDNILAVTGAEAEAKVIGVNEIADNLCDLVEVKNVTISTDGAENPKFYANEGENNVQIYNSFHVEGYNNDGLAAMVGETLYNIKGIAYTYNSTPEIVPVDGGIVTGISDIKYNETENGVIYNIAGQRVDASYKGIVIMNGKKIVKK